MDTLPFILAFALTNIHLFVRNVSGQCPAGYTDLGPPISGECPQDPVMSMLIGEDCCAPGACTDKAKNCMAYTAYCNIRRYRNCMRDKCALTCGVCTPMDATATV